MTTARKLALFGLAALAVVAALGGLRLFDAARDLRAAERSVEVAEQALVDGRIRDARGAIAAAAGDIQQASESLRSPSLTLLGVMPVVRQNLDSLYDSVELAATVIHGGQRILSSTESLEGPDGTLQVSLADGSVPVAAVVAAMDEIGALLDQLPPGRASGSSPLLLPPVREAERSVRDAWGERRAQLDRLDRGLTLLHELVGIERPRRYLLAVANTAEMRGAGGMMLNFGVLEGRDGVVDLIDFGRVEELPVRVPVDPVTVPLPADLLGRWDGFAMTQEWRNATVSSDFTVVGPLLEKMYQRASGLPADGVIQIDPTGLAGLLSAVGPVQVPEVGEVSAQNVEALVLNEAYIRFPGIERRSDVLGDVAEATFRRLVDGEYPSVRRLAEAVAAAVDGRHLIVHSRSPRVQDAVRSFGAAGSLPDATAPDSLHLSVQNVSGNKLDYYLDTAVRLEGARPAGSIGTLRATVTLTNTAPAGVASPRYIFGPFDADQAVGLYRGVVSIYLPVGTSLQEAAGGPFRIAPSMQTEGGRPVLSTWIDVPAGESRTIEVDLRMAPRPGGDEYRIRLVPSPRVRPTAATVSIDVDGVPVEAVVVLDRPWSVGPDGPIERSGIDGPLVTTTSG